MLDGEKFEDGNCFNDFYRIIDILIQLRFLNTKGNKAEENKKRKLLKKNYILFNNNVDDKIDNIFCVNKIGLMIAKILGFIFAYQNEIYILLKMFFI